jgi:hypothetical protein
MTVTQESDLTSELENGMMVPPPQSPNDQQSEMKRVVDNADGESVDYLTSHKEADC